MIKYWYLSQTQSSSSVTALIRITSWLMSQNRSIHHTSKYMAWSMSHNNRTTTCHNHVHVSTIWLRTHPLTDVTQISWHMHQTHFDWCDESHRDTHLSIKWIMSYVLSLVFNRHHTQWLMLQQGWINHMYHVVLDWGDISLHSINLSPKWLVLYHLYLTLKVLKFWKFTSYRSLKPLWSDIWEVVPAHTSPTLHPPSPPTVHQLSWLAL